MAIPTFDLTLAPPGRMTMPNIVGGAIEGGRTMSGLVSAVDMTGGGLVAVKYSQVALGNADPARLRYWSQLSAILGSGVRSILVPLLTDFIVPQDWAVTVATAAAVNAGTIQLTIAGAFLTYPGFMGGEWFGLVHPTKSARAYCITDIDATTANTDGTITQTVGIRPPLREGIAAGAAANLSRPPCLMRLAPGSTMSVDVEKAWWATPDVSFVESFGTT